MIPRRKSWTSGGVIYTVYATWIDIETGQIVHWTERKKRKYIKIKTLKNYVYNATKSKCRVELTIECKRDPQQRIEFS